MTTRLIAIRHGKPKSDGYAEDALRPLSEEGEAIQRRVTEELKGHGLKPTMILTSPLLRALQTAEVISEIFKIPVYEDPALGVEFDGDALLDSLPAPEFNETVVLVGHAPTLAQFVEKLVGAEVLPHGLAKSSAAVIDFHDEIGIGKAKFVGYYAP